ncbi:hypothetical protein MBRA1_003947 [Malassezia brasiliensis]|uniref:Major facilitator superfamily (MFS) profile domain-containing protein n=1 Tax=Malassezia brasiliensis TaxID=1821822 RepID=A0AAF0DVT6_9BASI|nr:hypothetical protein MBRA1_003947 [Malassezia brasiliensis]
MRPGAPHARAAEPPDTPQAPAPQLESVGAIEVPVPPQDTAPAPVEDDEHYSAFTKSGRIFVVVLASVSGVMSPFSINIYMPAVPQITTHLHITDSQTLLSITTYMIFQGLSPSFWAPLSDSYGRRPILIMAFVVFLIANLGLSFTQAYWLLLVLRMLQASGASSAVSIGAGCISDVSRRKERGTYMGFFQMGTLLGPAIGPIVGGLVAHRWDWHAIFFFLSALGGGYLVFMVLMLPESLRALVGDGSLKPYGIWRTLIPLRMVDHTLHGTDAEKQHARWMNAPPKLNLHAMGFDRPWRTFLQPDLALMILSFSIPFGVYTMVTSSLSPALSNVYHYNTIVVGLCYVPLGVGSALGSILAGKLLDFEYRRAFQKHGKRLNLHHTRLKHAFLFNFLFTAFVLASEWCMDVKEFDRPVHIAAPMVLLFFMTLTGIMFFNSIQTILVDLSPGRAASVTAALNIGRCLVGAAFVAAVQYAVDAIGSGWTFVLFALASFAISTPLVWIVMRHGPRWSTAREERLAKKV